MTLLPVRPLPGKDESLPGYVTRLALANGWPSGQALLKAVQAPYSLHNPGHWGDIVQVLVKYTGHEAQIQDAWFTPGQRAAFLWDAHRALRHLALSEARLCPTCLSQGPLDRAEWQFLPYTHCSTHVERLLSACPQCDEPFAIGVGLVHRGCAHCASPWARMRSDAEDLPRYQQRLLSLSKHDELQRYLRDISAAAMRAIRPYDGLIDVAEHPPSGTDWVTVLSTAYALLSDRHFAGTWAEGGWHARSEVVVLGTEAVMAPITALQNRLEGHWQVQRLSLDKTATTEHKGIPALGLSQRRARRVNTDAEAPDIALRYQTDVHRCAQVIGCDVSTISALTDAGVLTPMNGARMTRDAIFDLRQLSERLNRLPICDSEEARELGEYSTLLSVYGVSEGEPLLAVLRGQLRAYIHPAGQRVLDRLVVHPLPMQRYLRRSLHARARDPKATIKATEARALLQLPEQDMAMLVRDRIIEPISTSRSTDRFLFRDIAGLIEQYWVLPRAAYIRGVPRPQLARRLAQQGIRPACGRFLYRRSARLRAAVRGVTGASSAQLKAATR